MAQRKKNVYRCIKCNKRFGSSPKAAQHFAKYPSHRTDKQLRKHTSNMKASAVVRERLGVSKRRSSVYDRLPTVERKFKEATQRAMSKRVVGRRYCTECGGARTPSNKYCGGCGGKL